MQATVNSAQNEAEFLESHGGSNLVIKRCAWQRLPTVLPTLLICLLLGYGSSVAQTMSHSNNAPIQSDAQKAFEKLKTLAGTWQGTLMGMPINVTMRVTSNGNAILHEATSSTRPDDPITMFYVEGDRLLATHYCDSGNRPRMEGKMSPDGKTIEFNLVDVVGNTQNGYMGQIVFTFVDSSHHNEGGSWTFPAKKQSFQIPGFELTRTK